MIVADPLSHVLDAIEAKSVVSTGLNASGDWAVAVGRYPGIKFNAVIAGQCQLKVEGLEQLTLAEGDCFLLTQGLPFVIASDLALPPRPASEVFRGVTSYFAELLGDGEADFCCIGGRMDIAVHARFVTAALPPLIVLRADGPEGPRIRWLLERLVAEIAQLLPGSHAIASQIMHMIFIETMRSISNSAAAEHGWLAALLDRNIGKALRAIHENPDRQWLLDEIAAEAGLSRSHFSARFVEIMGIPPMDYLLRWRMALAAKALEATGKRAADVAFESGYQSEAAFGAAFKRIHGISPGQYRRQFKASN